MIQEICTEFKKYQDKLYECYSKAMAFQETRNAAVLETRKVNKVNSTLEDLCRALKKEEKMYSAENKQLRLALEEQQ